MSSTFVVDLNSLEHPDDIKKDEFRKWKYSGSHSVPYMAWSTGKGLQFERFYSCSPEPKNVFQLHGIHCKHPTNADCVSDFWLLFSGDLRPGSSTFIMFFDIIHACCWT